MKLLLVTYLGSLPRTQDVVDFIFACENNEQYDQAESDQYMASGVSATH